MDHSEHNIFFQSISAVGSTPFSPSYESPYSPRRHKQFQSLTDDLLSQLTTALRNHSPPPDIVPEVLDCFTLYQDQLYLIDDERLFQVISFHACKQFFEQEHNKFHGSPIVLLDLLILNAQFHPHAQLIATDVVKNCPNCDLFSRFQELPAPLQQIKTPNFGDLWHIDFVGPLTSFVPFPTKYLTTFRYILVAVEYVSGYCFAFPTNNMESDTVCRFLFHLFTFFPIPHTILSDNGSDFVSSVTQSFIKQFKIKWRLSSAYYPQANSKVERVNGLIKKLLKGLDPMLEKWPLYLFQALRIYNNTTTIFNTSPSELMFGFKSIVEIPNDNILQIVESHIRDSKDYNILELDASIFRLHEFQLLQQYRQQVFDKKFQARSRFKLLNDPKYNDNSFTTGEFVFLKKKAKRKKTDPNYSGPFIISQVFDKNAYKLKNLQGIELKATYNISHLRPCYQHYGSPFRSISDYTQAFGDDERKLFTNTFKL